MPRPTRSRAAASKPAAQARGSRTSSRKTRASSPNLAANTESADRAGLTKEKRSSRRAAAEESILSHSRDSSSERALHDKATDSSENMASPSCAANSSGDADIPSIEGGRREQATARPRRTDVSGLDILDDDMFGGLDSSFEDENSTNAQHRTADNTSTTFTIGAFKRRPRQSSIVGKDDAPIRPSSRGQNTPGISSTFSLGKFKRRAREPSILGAREPSVSGAAQNESQRQPASDPTDDESDDESNGDEEPFVPEAEGTPIRRSSARRAAPSSAEGPLSASSRGNSRKRKSLEDHTGRPKRQAVSAEEEEVHDSIEVDDGPPTPPDHNIRPARRATPELDDDIMAPPESSSSSAGSPGAWPPLELLGRKRSRHPVSRAHKTPVPGDGVSDISSPPSLTHSPNFPSSPELATRGKGKAASKAEPPAKTTEELASLLPRRRHRAHSDDPYGLDSSDGEAHGHDDDELSYVPARRGRSRRPVRPLGGASTAKQAKSRATGNEAAPPRKPVKRTYGSRSFSDKENQAEPQGDTIEVSGDVFAPSEDEDPFASGDEGDTTQADFGDELKKAAKKFKEVDKWELEFEEVVQSSSPKAAR